MKSDIKHLNRLLKIGQVLGVIPKNESKRSVHSILYAIIFIIILSVAIVNLMFFNESGSNQMFFSYFLQGLDNIIIFIFGVSGTISAFRDKLNWNIITKNFLAVDSVLLHETDFPINLNECKSWVKIFLCSITVWILYILFTLQYDTLKLKLCGMVYALISYQMIYLLLIVTQLNGILNKRCHIFNQIVQTTFISSSVHITKYLDDRIMQLQTVIFSINKAVQSINNIFGFRILLAILCVGVDILVVFSYALYILNQNQIEAENLLEVITGIIFCCVLPVSTKTV